jgi:DNA-binding NtrC family response regulator
VVSIPPLRDRPEDIMALAEQFLVGYGRTAHLDDAQRAALLGHRFAGNVRELRTVIERACALAAPDERLELELGDDDGEERKESGPVGGTLKEARDALVSRFERDYLVRVLAENGGNVSRTARAAGIDRNHLHRLIKRHGIER